jgi:DNA-binding response OmpR family regulator
MADDWMVFPLNKTSSSRSLKILDASCPASSLAEGPINLPAHPTILIVDDDIDILTALHDLIEHEGFRVTEVSTCLDALVQARTVSFVTVLLDIGLPDGDGITVLETLQTTAPFLPVIILTAFTSQAYRARSLSSGAFSCLTKPYNRDELRAVLRRAVKVSQSPMLSDN